MEQTDPPAKVASNDQLGARDGLASDMRSPFGQPRFIVQDDGLWIDDDDFLFDAALKISGDFAPGERLRFAQWICDALNEADKLLPRRPDDGLGPNIQRMNSDA